MSRPLVRPVPYDEALQARIARDGPSPSNLRTLAEWQYAADLASLVLTLDAARQFGLVEGAPDVDVERASRILDQAARRRIEPAPSEELMDRFLGELMAPAEASAEPLPDNVVQLPRGAAQ